MRFTLGRTVHVYYVTVLILFSAVFAYGVKHYWDNGLLNNDFVSSLYDGSNRVKSVKERNDIEELKRFINGDRVKDAQRVFARIDNDVKDLKLIKEIEKSNKLEEKLKSVGVSLNNLQTKPDLNSIINKLGSVVSNFENFVTENNWPTISRMTRNLRMKLSPSRLMVGGLYSFDRTQTLSQTVNNDIEALTNFVKASDLRPEIISALNNRINSIKVEADKLVEYVDDHQKINVTLKELTTSYNAWFKTVEPQIALKKIEFEKNSQSIFYSLIGLFSALMLALCSGVILYNFSSKKSSGKVEKLIIDTIKDGLLPVETKKLGKFSAEFHLEFDKYKEYTHKRMSFGAIFQDSIPFSTIILDSNLNLIWGNSQFYEDWQLQNFKEDEDSLTWDFLQRFTDLQDNTSVMNALRMSAKGAFDIQVKTNAMEEALPFEMHISPVDYANQKRILITFYPIAKNKEALKLQKESLLNPLMKALDLQLEEQMTIEEKETQRALSEEAGSGELFSKLFQYIDKVENIRDELTGEIEELELTLVSTHEDNEKLKEKISNTIDLQKNSIGLYGSLRESFSALFDSRDQMEDQYKMALSTSRELFGEQAKVFSVAQNAQTGMESYIKSLKQVTNLKSQLKELKVEVDEYKSKVTQILDQILIFQNPDNESQKFEQFMGQVKFQMKGFDRVLTQFSEVSTQLDVSITKLDMLVENREIIDLDDMRTKIEGVRHTLENLQFSGTKVSQLSHSKDDELMLTVKNLVSNLKTEIKETHEMGSVLKMNYKEVTKKREVSTDIES